MSGGTQGLGGFFRGFRAAATLLTRVPVGGFPYSDAEWRWAGAHLPAVGMLLGAFYGGVWLATLRAGAAVAAVMAILASLLITGAIHEDGLADTADALGGAQGRERVFAILKDSRIGAFGGAAIAITLLLRVSLLARLGPAAPLALILTSAASRLPPVWLMASLPYVTDPNVAKSGAVVAAGRAQAVVATSWVALLTGAIGAIEARGISGAFHRLELAIVWAVAAAVALGCGRVFRARAGGITGDFLGATQQVGECAMLLALAMVQGGPGR